MSFDFQDLENKYRNDAAFNKCVRVFTSLFSEHGFTPSEIREMLFFAQWRFQLTNVEQIIRTEDEWRDLERARELMKATFLKDPITEFKDMP